jgi:hypothetical protein
MGIWGWERDYLQWVESIGVANKNMVFVMLVNLAK